MSVKAKKTCNYSRHKCTRYQYRDYQYCYQHILEDKTAPFISCQYISKITKRRCHNPALNNEQSLPAICELHQMEENARKLKHKSSVFYDDRENSDVSTAYNIEKLQGLSGSQKLDIANFKSIEIDAKSNSNWPIAKIPSWKLLEADIDADSYDEDDSPLQNAGVLTLEEVATVSTERMIKLQSLYLTQFNQLHRQLQEKRRQYLLDDSPTLSKTQKSNKYKDEKVQEFRSLVNYRKHSRENQLLYQKSKRRRMQAMAKQSNVHPEVVTSSKAKCSHVSSHVRCKNSCLPYTKYCIVHIYEDPLQVLYKKCSKKFCTTPVCLLLLQTASHSEKIFCPLHQDLLPISEGLDALIDEVKTDSIRLFQPTSSTSRTSDPVKESPNPSSSLFQDVSSSISITDDTEKHVLKETSLSTTSLPKEEKMDVTFTASPDVSNDAMDVDSPSNNSEAAQQESEARTAMETTLTAQSRLSPAKFDEFKSGQRFLMNKVTVYDEAENRCVQAIHLEPVDDYEDKTSDVPTSKTSSTLKENEQLEKLLPACEHSEVADHNLTASVRHHGMLMSVEKCGSNKESASVHKIAASVTLIPPVEENIPSNEAKSENLSDENKVLEKMPSLAPISSPFPELRKDDEESFSGSTSSAAEQIMVKERSPDKPKVTSFLDDTAYLPLDKNAEDSEIHKSRANSDESSNDNGDSDHIKGGDVGDINSTTDRKPSSADEETAIASLLFLSSGTLQKH